MNVVAAILVCLLADFGIYIPLAQIDPALIAVAVVPVCVMNYAILKSLC